MNFLSLTYIQINREELDLYTQTPQEKYKHQDCNKMDLIFILCLHGYKKKKKHHKYTLAFTSTTDCSSHEY